MSLSDKEKDRYSRHLLLPKFGVDTQLKLKHAKVLIIGAGGLGAPVLQYLTAAGIGTIGLVDYDSIDASNLQRQVLFENNDIGKSKNEVAIAKLEKQNPYVTFINHNIKLDSSNAMRVIANYDIIVDGSDNFPTRYLINDACVLGDKPLVSASIYQYEGQLSVFNYRNEKGELGPNYRDLYPLPPAPEMVPSCAEGGVLGVLPGIVGAMQANEVIKMISGIGELLLGKLLVYNALDCTSRIMNLNRDIANPLTGEKPTITQLIDYEVFCGLADKKLKAIDAKQLNQWIIENKDFLLIDVRKKSEYNLENIDGLNIPVDEIEGRLNEIPADKPVVMHCRSGARSRKAIQWLEANYDYNNLYNLDGGIVAMKRSFKSRVGS